MYGYEKRISHIARIFTFLMVFSILYLSISPIYIHGQAAATVSGRVVDEDGRGIGNVRIEIYSPDGALVKSMETSSDGSFIFQSKVTLARRTFRFSKDGFVNVTKTLMLSEGETIELGDIVLLKAVRLTTSILGIAASPGDKLTLPFTVSNLSLIHI